MKSKIILFLFCLFSYLYSSQEAFYEDRCPYGCGQRHMDEKVIFIQKAFAQCIYKVFDYDLSNKNDYGSWAYTPSFLKEDPSWGRYYSPSFVLLCYGIRLDSSYKFFRGKYDIGWDIHIDDHVYPDEDYDEDDIYYDYFIPKGYSKDTEYVKQDAESYKTLQEETFALSNPFDFTKMISILERDLKEIYDQKIQRNEEIIKEYREEDIERIQGYEDWKPEDKQRCIQRYLDDIKYVSKESNKEINKLTQKLQLLTQYEQKIYSIYDQIHTECIEKHGFAGAYYYRGFNYFLLGKNLDFLSDIEKFLEKQDLPSNIYLMKGQAEEEIGLYHEAIISLSKAIKKDPNNKKAYFERAACYFEKGDFNKAISDFLESGYKSTPIDPNDSFSLDFSRGFIVGTLKGGAVGVCDFFPSLLSTASGLSHGLWALVRDPINVSKEIVNSCISIVDYIRTQPLDETLCTIVPELKELVTDWNKLPDLRKGEIIGYVIGKYGVDIFLTAGSIKAIKIARQIRNANKVLLLENLAKDTIKAKIIKESAISWNKNKSMSIGKLAKAGQEMDRGGLTKAGRALAKHGGREGSVFPQPKGPSAAINKQGQEILESILNNPSKIIPDGNIGFEIYLSDGKGAYFKKDGTFRGFVEWQKK